MRNATAKFVTARQTRPVTNHADSAIAHAIDQIPWLPTNPDGTKSATLVGTRDPGVTFTYAFFIPAGVWDQPHSHIADAHLVVASGELRLGYGTLFNPTAAGRFPTGSFLYVPATTTHFDGADEDTILLGTAVGPWTTDYHR